MQLDGCMERIKNCVGIGMGMGMGMGMGDR